MMQMTFNLTTLEPKSKRKPCAVYEQKRLLIPEFLTLINSQVKKPYSPITEMQFKIRMNDAGYVTVESWYTLLAELKQSSKPGALWGFKVKLK
jgi:hypothetical protein